MTPSAASRSAPRLVVLRALGLGDFLTSVPAYRALAKAFPGHRKILAAPAVLARLARMCGAIDEVVDTAALAPLDRSLHESDVAVNLHGRGPESTRVLMATRPRRLLAFACSGFDDPSLPRWYAGEHETLRWCRMLRAFGIEADPESLDLHAEPEASSPPAVVVHPGAAAPSRCWPESRWIEIVRRLKARGVPITITGSAGEFRLARRIAHAAELPIDCVVAGKTPLERLARILAGARALVCADTGVAHLGTAMGTPSVVLFGPIPPSQWGPPPSRAARHRAIWHGRHGDPHGSAVDPGLLDISVDEVVEQLRNHVDVA